ncbi:hypothetical protein ACQKKX_03010 [Neorhizobium sp. NPDC001467]|uniref:hypothetical protein n=1 Tax=Neorhizobium sp. NPDC001467 TaxID=3390595 RepID=UPI003CFD1DB3
MARRHPADDELARALTMLSAIEEATAHWLPPTAPVFPADGRDRDAVAGDEASTSPAGSAPAAAGLIEAIESAGSGASPLVRLVRRIDDAIGAIIARADDRKSLRSHEKLWRRLRFGSEVAERSRRDAALSDEMVAVLERAASLTAALARHRQVMKTHFALFESDLDRRLAQAKSMEGDSMSEAIGQLGDRQNLVEGLIRHEAACNGLYHKLGIEAERGIVVLRALAGSTPQSLADRFPADARHTLSPLLTLCEKNLLSMRDMNNRRHAVDDRFRHRFNRPSGRPASSALVSQQGVQTRQHTPDTVTDTGAVNADA